MSAPQPMVRADRPAPKNVWKRMRVKSGPNAGKWYRSYVAPTAIDGLVRSGKVRYIYDPPSERDQVDTAQPQPTAPVQQDMPAETETAELEEEAAALGVRIDKRWGADRLQLEIAKAKARETAGA